MGCFTSIGFIYSISNNIYLKNELFKIIDFLIKNNGHNISYSFCEDEMGVQWVNNKIVDMSQIKDFINIFISKYYGKIHLMCNLFNKNNIQIDISYKVLNHNSFGVLLEIPETQLLDNTALTNISNSIVEFIIQVHKISSFDYSFCDNEAEIEYSSDEFELINSPIYSVVVSFYNNREVIIKFSSWHIDGLTKREI